jgi:hypothetical protein
MQANEKFKMQALYVGLASGGVRSGRLASTTERKITNYF